MDLKYYYFKSIIFKWHFSKIAYNIGFNYFTSYVACYQLIIAKIIYITYESILLNHIIAGSQLASSII